MKTDIMGVYDSIKDDLKFYGISGVRMKIILSLMDGPKKTRHLRELIGIQSSTILHGINELEKQKIVSRNVDNYYLSEIGQILALKLEDMIKTLVTIRNNQKLWLNHEIEGIPHDLLMRIGDLSNSNIIESNNTDIFRIHNMFIETIKQAEEIKGISPFFHPDFTEEFLNLMNKGVKVELIITDEILKELIKSFHKSSLKDFIKLVSKGNLNLWILNEVKLALTVTDKHLSLGLYTKNGGYDPLIDLVSEDYDAIEWGNTLFKYYRKKSDKIELKRLDKIISHLI
jgi:predicted transcriptional regulator